MDIRCYPAGNAATSFAFSLQPSGWCHKASLCHIRRGRVLRSNGIVEGFPGTHGCSFGAGNPLHLPPWEGARLSAICSTAVCTSQHAMQSWHAVITCCGSSQHATPRHANCTANTAPQPALDPLPSPSFYVRRGCCIWVHLFCKYHKGIYLCCVATLVNSGQNQFRFGLDHFPENKGWSREFERKRECGEVSIDLCFSQFEVIVKKKPSNIAKKFLLWLVVDLVMSRKRSNP